MSCPRETDIGAYVLNALEPAERQRVTAHLSDCTACTRTLVELGTLPTLLAAVPSAGVLLADPEPSELAFERLRCSLVSAEEPRRRTRWLLAVTAAALVVVGALGTGVVMSLHRSEPTTVEASSGSVHARVTIRAEGTGSAVTLTMNGMRQGDTCWLVAVGRDGERHRTPSWSVDYDGDLSWKGQITLAPDQLSLLEVVAGDGRTIVTLPA
jgi:Putative zinc-finger